jgi:hypothetical protein
MAKKKAVRDDSKASSSISKDSFSITIEAYPGDLSDLGQLFSESLEYGLNQLGRAGRNSIQNTIEESVTQWGQKRMAGESAKWTFTPYGISEGRQDTGFMYDSVGYEVTNNANQHMVSFGWVNWYESYFEEQEKGFRGITIMGGVSGGYPRFKKTSKPYDVPGMGSLPIAESVVKRLIPSFVQGAWNEAKRNFNAQGGGGTF